MADIDALIAANGKPAPNGTESDPNPEGLVRVRIFPNEERGAFHGLTKRGLSGTVPEGYDRTVNMSARSGAITPSFAPSLADTLSSSVPPVAIIPWQTTDTEPVPTAIILQGSGAKLLKNDSPTNETDATTATYSSACFHDNGSGTAHIYAGTSTGSKLLNRRTQAGSWSQDADVSAIFIVSAAGALWRTTSDYQISKCPAGSDPFTIGQWGTSIQVGNAATSMLNLAAIGAAPVCFKSDGIYTYDENNSRFENQWQLDPHPDHFKFVKPDGRGGLLTSTAFGELVHILPTGFIKSIDIRSGKMVSRDTPRGRIVNAAVRGNKIFLLMDRGARFSQPPGMTVVFYDSSATMFTDFTDEATDQRFDRVVDVGSMEINADMLLIGSDAPFVSVQMIVKDANTTATPIQVGRITSASRSLSTLDYHNGTDTDPSTIKTFGQSGAIALKTSKNITSWSNFVLDNEPNAYDKYWLVIYLNAG